MNSRAVKLLTFTLWLVTLALAFTHMELSLKNDTALLLHHTKKLLGGGVAYVDFADTNPPLILLIYSLPRLLADFFTIEPYRALNLFTLALTGMSLWLASAILRASPLQARWRRALIAMFALVLMAGSFLHNSFADRDYLLVIFLLPLLSLYAPLGELHPSKSLRLLAGALAGLAVCLKPYAIMPVLAALLYRISYTRIRRNLSVWEFISFAGIVASYAAVLAVWFPSFFEFLLPGLVFLYPGISWGWASKLGMMREVMLPYVLPAAFACAALAAFAHRFYHAALTYLWCLLLGALAAYAISGGWYYVLAPFILLSMALALIATFCLTRAVLARCRRHGYALALAAWLAMSGALGYVFVAPSATYLAWSFKLIREHDHTLDFTMVDDEVWHLMRAPLNWAHRFLWLSTDLWATAPLKRGNYESVGRFDYLWPLPQLVRLRQQNSPYYAALHAWFARAIAEDIIRHQPPLIIADASPNAYLLPVHFDLIEFLSEDSVFATVLQAYKSVGTIDTCERRAYQNNCRYRLFIRNERTAPLDILKDNPPPPMPDVHDYLGTLIAHFKR